MKSATFVVLFGLMLGACGSVDRTGGDEGSTGWDPEARTCTWQGQEYEEEATFASEDGCLLYECTPQGVTVLEDNMEAIAGDVDVESQSELAELVCVVAIDGSLAIGSANAGGDIDDLTPLSNLADVGQDLVIADNPALSGLVGLAALGSIGGDLRIERNPSLASLAGLSGGLTVLDAVRIIDNDALLDLNGLGFLASCFGCDAAGGNEGFPGDEAPEEPPAPGLIYGDLEIAKNDNLGSTGALEGLGSILGSLRVSGNPALSSGFGFGSLTEVTGDLSITDNASYPTVEAEAISTYAAVGGITTVCGNLDGAACP